VPTHICPACHKRFAYARIETHPTYPFCSERCRLAELGAWLNGRYVISEPPEEAGDGETPGTGGGGPDDEAPDAAPAP
jgi:endogenous inhibitor of DNA gyrase (YacG/DUF329 family)